jgi:ankyrin repeat protein
MLEPTLVADILAVGGNPNAVARRGITPLYVAAHTGDPATTELLLACGADASLRETEGYTVLHAAVYSGSIATLDVLRQGDCIAEPQSARRSLLDIAFRRRDPQMLTALLGRLRDVPDLQPLLTRAVQQYQSDMVAALLDAGASLDSCKSLVPPVVSAAMAGDAPLIRRLIALGRSPNELHDGRTPLEHLLRYERSRLSTYLEVVEVLLDSGAVLDRPSIDGGTVRSLLAEAVREQGELSTAFRAMLKRHAFD